MHRIHPLFILLAGCGGELKTPGESATVSTAETDPSTDSTADSGTDSTESPIGLSERPANPSCHAPERPPALGELALEPVWSSFAGVDPIMARPHPDGSRWYVLTQGGGLWTFLATEDGQLDGGPSLALDLSDQVRVSFEEGLLGFALHPGFEHNGQAFVSYSAAVGGQTLSRISRVHSSDGGQSFDPASEEILFELEQPFSNHNGGDIHFGPEGHLYLGLGDGGSAGDPLASGQDTDTLLGGMLRLDVDGGTPYAIPADNPFAAGGGAPELYAWGLRNPWRFSFDSQTGDLWTGDVGQDAMEEVDRIELGGNYGWDELEGSLCYELPSPCEAPHLPPVVEYEQISGSYSVIGGVVYRGEAMPELQGRYLFAEHYTGEIFGIHYDPGTGVAEMQLLAEAPELRIASFAAGTDGEVIVVDHKGSFHKLVPAEASPPSDFPTTLSATGCVDPENPEEPASGLIPYEINSPLWSDGADKRRWLALPDGQAAHPNQEGDLDLPVGSVLMKEFRLADRPVETRLFVRHDDGAWAGYSYRWRGDGTDADWVRGGAVHSVEGQDWRFPSSAECLQCHTEAAGYSLGLEAAQLDRTMDYPGGSTGDQLATLEHIGVVDASFPDVVPLLPLDAPEASLRDRSRSYLHSNCASCHQPEGPAGGDLDLRWISEQTGGCEAVPTAGDLGVPGALIIDPGSPDSSVLSLRMQALDAQRMPPLASSRVDVDATSVIEDWIAELESCD